MKDFINRLSSRKFLLAVATMATLAANKQWPEFTAAALTYVLAEGGTDAARAYKDAKQAIAGVSSALDQVSIDTFNDDLAVDKTRVVAGSDEVGATPVIPATP